MRNWADVAVLAKTKNLKGRFVARAAAGLPFLLEEGDEVRFVPPQLDAPRLARVSFLREIDRSSAEIEFGGISGDEAAMLVGCHCLIERAAFDEALFESEPPSWEGWQVIDGDAGFIGAVKGVLANPGQNLLEIERADGGTLLVPAVEEIVLDVDEEAGVIRVDLPTGLLDL